MALTPGITLQQSSDILAYTSFIVTTGIKRTRWTEPEDLVSAPAHTNAASMGSTLLIFLTMSDTSGCLMNIKNG